jgi:hypothetical protein
MRFYLTFSLLPYIFSGPLIPIGFWPLNPSTFGTGDVSVNNISTTAHKLAQSEGPCGILDTGYGFDHRSRSHLVISKTGRLAVQNFTAAVYINPATANLPIFEYKIDANYDKYGVYCWIKSAETTTSEIKSAELFCNLKSKETAVNVIATNLKILLNTWTFLAVSVDVFWRNIIMMVNNERYFKKLESIGTLNTNGELLLGARILGGDGPVFFSGKMANFLIFDRALSEPEIERLKLKCPIGKNRDPLYS